MPSIVHHRNKCIGCGICFELQPECWRMSKKDGKATLLLSVAKKQVWVRNMPTEQEALTREVAQACPVRVIKVQ